MGCRKCGKDNIKVIETIEIRDDGSRHIKCTCGECGEYLFYKQWQDNTAFIMPFGKFKGLTISEIVNQSKHYAEWAAKNMKNNIGRRFVEELGLKGSGEPVESMSADGKKAYGPGNPEDAPF